MITIDISLANGDLYAGCEINEVGGRANLVTPVAVATNIVGRNAQAIVDATPVTDRKAVTLTGAMAVWSYLVVFHVVLHRFNEVWYNDGRNPAELIAAHG